MFGGIGTFAAWVSVIVLHVDARYVGIGWMVVGLVGYVIYRRRQGLDLVSHYRIERRERPAFFVELEYRSALVPIFGTDVDASALRAAAKLVGEDARGRGGLHPPRPQPAVARRRPRRRRRQLGLSVLESAKVAGRKAGLKVQTRLIRTRSPGAAIVEEAQRSGAEIIYLGTAHAPPSERALGPTATLPARASAVPGRDRDPAGQRQGHAGWGRRRHWAACCPRRVGRRRPRAAVSGRKAVADARLGADVSRPPGRLDLAPEVGDVGPQHLGVLGVAGTPDRIQQVAVGHQPPAVAGERRSRSNSIGVRWTSSPSTLHLAAGEIDVEPVGA